MDKSNFFYCYNKRLITFIKVVKKIDYITLAKHPVTDKIFAIFFKNSDLQKALDDYKAVTSKK